jgi:hypothetical protein
MARFDPNAYPDRLSFEANARRIRAEEIAKACGAAGAWLDARQHEIRQRLGAFAASVSAHSRRHSPR